MVSSPHLRCALRVPPARRQRPRPAPPCRRSSDARSNGAPFHGRTQRHGLRDTPRPRRYALPPPPGRRRGSPAPARRQAWRLSLVHCRQRPIAPRRAAEPCGPARPGCSASRTSSQRVPVVRIVDLPNSRALRARRPGGTIGRSRIGLVLAAGAWTTNRRQQPEPARTSIRVARCIAEPFEILMADFTLYRVMLLTCEYMSSAALITLEFDS